jgi:uncharacterized protein (DUF2336 family)
LRLLRRSCTIVVTLPTLPNLDGLIGLARQDGVDVRPTLVRVLTDLYVQKRSHTRDEEHRYTELVLWLIASVDVATRAAVARKLASYAHAPRLVARRLARDVFEVAEPVLKWSPCLTSEDLLAIIRDFGPRYAGAIAQRELVAPLQTDESTEAADVDVATPAMAHTVNAPPPAPLEEREPPSTRGGLAPLASGSSRVAIGDFFLSLGTTERRVLLTNLRDGTNMPSESPAAASEEAIRALETAALERRPDDFARALERALRVSSATAQAIVADDAGEPLVVAARALGMPADVFLRVLLFLNPAIGHSVERVFDLVDLFDELSAEAGLQIVASWQNALAGEKRAARHQPLHWDDETRGARRTFAGHAPRFPLQAPDDRRPAAGEERIRAQRTT